jgi:hypothetical protein
MNLQLISAVGSQFAVLVPGLLIPKVTGSIPVRPMIDIAQTIMGFGPRVAAFTSPW